MPKDDIEGLFDKAEEHLKATRRAEPLSVPGAAPPKPTVPRPRPKPEASPVSEPAPVFDAREAPTKQLPGRRRRAGAEESVYPPVVQASESVDMDAMIVRQATRLSFGRTLVLIAAAGTAVSGIIAATGAAVVNVITAMRPPSNVEIAKRLDGMETRLNGDFGLKLETETRQKKDEELDKKIEKVENKVKTLANALPAKVKVHVNPKSDQGER
ncbi:MAG TPA: hypothetical protein VGB13_10960 [Candidatus Krumholzibacteria bacterium]